VQAGGYQQRSFWSDEDWQWLQTSGTRHPNSGSNAVTTGSTGRCSTKSFTMSCRFTSAMRKPPPMHARRQVASTEAQYQSGGIRSGIWSSDGNFDFRSWTPRPVGSMPESRSAFGVSILWATVGMDQHHLRALSRISAIPFYSGYSADFFDGRPFVLKGASPRRRIACTAIVSGTGFQPHYPNVMPRSVCKEIGAPLSRLPGTSHFDRGIPCRCACGPDKKGTKGTLFEVSLRMTRNTRVRTRSPCSRIRPYSRRPEIALEHAAVTCRTMSAMSPWSWNSAAGSGEKALRSCRILPVGPLTYVLSTSPRGADSLPADLADIPQLTVC